MTAIKTILITDYEIIDENGELTRGGIKEKYSDLIDLFKKAEIRAIWPTYDFRNPIPSGEDDPYLRLLNTADAILVIGNPQFIDENRSLHILNSRLDNGIRIWIDAPMIYGIFSDQPIVKKIHSLLNRSGITITSIRISDNTTKHNDETCFVIKKENQNTDFRDSNICNNLNTITLYQPYGLRLTGNAFASVAIYPSKDLTFIDTELNEFETWNERFVPIIATSNIGSKGGCIVASASLVIQNDFVTGYGIIPGAKHNASLYTNIAKFLTHSDNTRMPSIDEQIKNLIQKIERTLLDIIRIVFGADNNNWQDILSDDIKKKAEDKMRNKGDHNIPWYAYIDLSDLINTMVKNSAQFKPILSELGFPTSAKKIKKDILNSGFLIDLRIMDSHVTKRVISNHIYLPADVNGLETIDRNLIKIWKHVSLLAKN